MSRLISRSPFKLMPLRLQPAPAKSLEPGKHKLGCLLCPLPEGLSNAAASWAFEHVLPEHLGLGGYSYRPHVTVKYGFTEWGPETVSMLRALLARHGPIECRLADRLSLFRGNEDGDVLKVEVGSDALHALNASVAASFACQDKHPTYRPHVTLAYVLPEHAEYYAAMTPPFLGQPFTLTEAEFSGPDGQQVIIPLSFLGGLGSKAGHVGNDRGGHWVTMGAHGGHGGTPVHLDGEGEIDKGPKGTTGKKPDELKPKRVETKIKPGGVRDRQERQEGERVSVPQVGPAKHEGKPPAAKAGKLPTAEEIGQAERKPLGLSGKEAGSAASLFKVEVGGRPYFVKSAESKDVNKGGDPAQRAKTEALAAEAAAIAGVRVPAAEVVEIGGKPHVVTEWVEGRSLAQEKDKRAALSRVPVEDVSRMILFDYASAFTDNHAGNYMVTEDGELVGIDREFSFDDGPEDLPALMEESELVRLAAGDTLAKQKGYALPRDQVASMAKATAGIAAALRRDGDEKRAKKAEARAAVLGKVAEKDRPTLGDLYRLSEG